MLDLIALVLAIVLGSGALFVVAPWLLMFWPGWSAFR